MAEPDNIEKFYDIAALLLATLYTVFPKPLDFKRGAFACDTFVSDSMLWLCDTGYLDVQAIESDGGVSGVTLSEKGLLVLHAAAPSQTLWPPVASTQTLGQQLRDAVQSGARQRAQALAEMAICQGSRWQAHGVSQEMSWRSPHRTGTDLPSAPPLGCRWRRA